MDKIGIGIITCNRPEYLKQLLNSLHPCKFDELIIVNDGNDIDKNILPSTCTYIKNETNLGVGKSKNKALKHLMSLSVKHIFIIEDDIIIKDINVFKKYIETSIETGIKHLNYALGTPFNRKQNVKFDLHNRHELDDQGEPNPRIIVDYGNIKIPFYSHICGMFSYYNSEVIESIGYIDEQFYNAWEHVDHTYQAIKKGFHPPFWWFADIHNSFEYLKHQKDAIKNSITAKNTDEWIKNVQINAEKYKIKNGTYPAQTPYVNQNDFLQSIKNIKNG